MGRAFDGESDDVNTVVLTCQWAGKQLIGGNAEELCYSITINGHIHAVVGIGADGDLSVVGENQSCVDHIAQGVLDALLAIHLGNFLIGQVVKTPVILVVSAAAEYTDSGEEQQSAKNIW